MDVRTGVIFTIGKFRQCRYFDNRANHRTVKQHCQLFLEAEDIKEGLQETQAQQATYSYLPPDGHL